MFSSKNRFIDADKFRYLLWYLKLRSKRNGMLNITRESNGQSKHVGDLCNKKGGEMLRVMMTLEY